MVIYVHLVLDIFNDKLNNREHQNYIIYLEEVNKTMFINLIA